jgi:regulator of protease activity HflC (stomatin/prohibitin superfamily)
MNKTPWFTEDRDGDRHLNVSKLVRLIATIGIVLIAVIVLWPLSIVSATERGIRFTFGEAENDVLDPGLHAHLPIVSKIKTWSIVPNKLAVDIPIGEQGAISKDNQIIGIRMIAYWQYNESRIYEAATKFDQHAIENMLASQTNSSVKIAIGKRTIYELADNQQMIGEEIRANMQSAINTYPIELTQINISNITWSSEFDVQIQNTMNRTQQVRQAEQDALITEQNSRKLTIEAEAKAKAAVAQATGEKEAAQLRADAARIEAEGIADANRMKATPVAMEFQRAEWAYEVQMERARHLAPGVEVPMYIPLAPNGTAAVITGNQR